LESPKYFVDVLTVISTDDSNVEIERRVRWELEGHSPIPIERLAYGWVRLSNDKVLYYATPFAPVGLAADMCPPGALIPAWSDLDSPDGVTEEDWNDAVRSDFSDIRDRGRLVELRRRESTGKLLRRLRLPMRVGVIAGLSLWLMAALFAAWTTLIDRRLVSSEGAATTALAKEEMLANMSRFSSGKHSVFDILAVVNRHRPTGVLLSRVEFFGNELVLEGRAGEVRQVNAYADELRASGVFGTIELPKIDTTGGRALFRLRLVPLRWPKVSPPNAEVTSGALKGAK
jgi:hypothetical protein